MSPGCGCNKTEPERATADASIETTDVAEPQPEHSEQREPDETGDVSTSPNGATEPSEEHPTPDETKTPQSSTNAGTSGDNNTGPSVTQAAVDTPKGDPRDAKRKAKEASAAAKKSAGKGSYSQAFREAREGWQAVSPFSQDAECRVLTQTLSRQMREVGTKANKNYQPDSTKTLIVE